MQAPDAWDRFGRRSFDHAYFNAAELAGRKSATLSVVLPALGEQRTIGTITADLSGRPPMASVLASRGSNDGR